jgi:hypothetical protein
MRGLIESDRAAIEALTYDRLCRPSYDLIKACLLWPDERPQKISNAGYEVLCDLWIVRGFIHRGLPPEDWGLDPQYFQAVWAEALRSELRWPGLLRASLSEEDRKVLLAGDAGASGEAG